MKHYAWFCCMALNLCVSIVIMLTSTWLKKYELMVQAMASISRGFVLLQLLIVKIINGLSKIISKILIFSGDSINK